MDFSIFIRMKKTNALRILERNKIPYQTLEYTYDPDNLDVRKIAADNDLDAKEVYKTLVAKGDKTGLLVAVIPGDKKLDRKALGKASGNKKINLVEISKLEKLTGYIRGGCSPIGMKSNPPVYLDASAEELDLIWVNAGVRGLLFGVGADDLVAASKAQVEDISTEEG